MKDTSLRKTLRKPGCEQHETLIHTHTQHIPTPTRGPACLHCNGLIRASDGVLSHTLNGPMIILMDSSHSLCPLAKTSHRAICSYSRMEQREIEEKFHPFSLHFFTPNHSSNTSKVISQSFRNCAYVTTAQMRRGVLGGRCWTRSNTLCWIGESILISVALYLLPEQTVEPFQSQR